MIYVISATKNGKMACIDIPSMECRKLSHYFNAFVTAIDVHPQEYIFNYFYFYFVVTNSI